MVWEHSELYSSRVCQLMPREKTSSYLQTQRRLWYVASLVSLTASVAVTTIKRVPLYDRLTHSVIVLGEPQGCTFHSGKLF